MTCYPAALDDAGFAALPDRIGPIALAGVADLFAALPPGSPGSRIDPRRASEVPAISSLGGVMASILAPMARPVRALLFDKRDDSNWALGWHQDRTIEVAARVAVPGYGPFTVKQGRLHVAPPIALVERMLTVRIHLDPVDADNGPLVVAPGSHRLGCLGEDAIDAAVARCGEAARLAEAGTVWVYRTPILHRSARAAAGRRRRVVQLDFSADACPADWPGRAMPTPLEGSGILA